jgi:plasmid stabilization system protein ParE
MAYKVDWTPDAIADLQAICDYLDDGWSPRVTDKFIRRCDDCLKLISEFPYLSHGTADDPNVRRILVSKQNALYFEIKGNTVYLLRFYDLRQDPAKNPFE